MGLIREGIDSVLARGSVAAPLSFFRHSTKTRTLKDNVEVWPGIACIG